MQIQWYPGHMAKARRQLAEQIKLVDVVVELCDARLPTSSRNPILMELTHKKPSILILNKSSLANDTKTREFTRRFNESGLTAAAFDALTSKPQTLFTLIEEAVADKIAGYKSRGVTKTIRALVVGIPNVGKSTLINRLAGRKAAKAEDRPGVTRTGQWVKCSDTLELLDTPGLLWPRIDDKVAAMRLAFVGTIRDQIIEKEELAELLLRELAAISPELIEVRYGIKPAAEYESLLYRVCEVRGFLLSGGRFNTERGADVVLDEFRSGKLGKVTLDDIH